MCEREDEAASIKQRVRGCPQKVEVVVLGPLEHLRQHFLQQRRLQHALVEQVELLAELRADEAVNGVQRANGGAQHVKSALGLSAEGQKGILKIIYKCTDIE